MRRARASPVRDLDRAQRVSVVIPALNEAENLPHVLAQLPDAVYEVVLVDGHSTDETVGKSRSADIATTTPPLPIDGGFHHVVATTSGGSVKLSIDGADVTRPVQNQTLSTDTTELAIGHHPVGSADSLYAHVDEPAVYAVALTAGQISQHYLAAAATTCSDVSGATADTYTFTAVDVDGTVRAVGTATNAAGSASARSAGSAAVAPTRTHTATTTAPCERQCRAPRTRRPAPSRKRSARPATTSSPWRG